MLTRCASSFSPTYWLIRTLILVAIFSVWRSYSRIPILRCAFSIGFSPSLSTLRQFHRLSMGIDQSEFIRPFLAPAHDLRISVDFVEFGDMLDRTPAGDMPVLALAEYPIKQ